jgi:transposase
MGIVVERRCSYCGYEEKAPFQNKERNGVIVCPICGHKNPWQAVGAMYL